MKSRGGPKTTSRCCPSSSSLLDTVHFFSPAPTDHGGTVKVRVMLPGFTRGRARDSCGELSGVGTGEIERLCEAKRLVHCKRNLSRPPLLPIELEASCLCPSSPLASASHKPAHKPRAAQSPGHQVRYVLFCVPGVNPGSGVLGELGIGHAP